MIRVHILFSCYLNDRVLRLVNKNCTTPVSNETYNYCTLHPCFPQTKRFYRRSWKISNYLHKLRHFKSAIFLLKGCILMDYKKKTRINGVYFASRNTTDIPG